MAERDEQQAVMDYAHGYGGNLDNRLSMLHPVENSKGAGRGPAGFEYCAGVPDLCLPVAVGPHHGLYIEMKTRKGKVSAKQRDWHKRLREQGFAAEVAYGAAEGIGILERYLANEIPPF